MSKRDTTDPTVIERLKAACPDGPDKPDQEATLIYLTPEAARKELADSNQMNRRLDEYEVRSIADIILSDRWAPNGETIGYDSDGQITNGQHRLAGIVLADQPVWAWVVAGLHPAVRPTIDDHKRRTFRDDLTMNGIPGGTLIESTQRKIMYWELNGGMSRRGPDSKRSRLMRVNLAEWYRDRGSEVTGALDAIRDYPRVPMSQAMKAFTWWLLTQYSPERTVERFFRIMSIGSQLPEDNVVVLLRDMLVQARTKVIGDHNAARRQTPEITWLVIRAWNAWLTGENLARINLPPGGPVNPYPEPITVVEK